MMNHVLPYNVKRHISVVIVWNLLNLWHTLRI